MKISQIPEREYYWELEPSQHGPHGPNWRGEPYGARVMKVRKPQVGSRPHMNDSRPLEAEHTTLPRPEIPQPAGRAAGVVRVDGEADGGRR